MVKYTIKGKGKELNSINLNSPNSCTYTPKT